MKKTIRRSLYIWILSLLTITSIPAKEGMSHQKNSFPSHTNSIDSSLLLQSGTTRDLSDYQVEYVGEESGVSILNFTGNYDRNINDVLNAEARQAVAQELYNYIAPNHDFLVVFTTFPVDSGEASAFAINYQNDVTGIGLPLFDNSHLMSSERLQTSIDMTEISDWELNPTQRNFDSTLDTLMHEMMHRWGIYVSFEDENNQISDALLGRDGVHWNYFMDSNASVMYGSLWVDVGGGLFETRATRKSLSPLDLYLMGFREAQSLPDFFYIDSGSPGVVTDLPPLVGTQANGIRKDFSVDDIIAVEGVRVPDVINSQHKFSFKFVLLKPPGSQSVEQLAGQLLVLQREFQKRFFAETGGLGSIEYKNIDDSLNSPQSPGSLNYNDVLMPASDLNAAVLFLLNSQETYEQNGLLGYWQDKMPTRVRDTAMAVRTFQGLNYPNTLGPAVSWLDQQQPDSFDDKAWMLLSDSLNGVKKAQIQNQLINAVNSDGGWGIEPDAPSSAYDTALVLHALNFSTGSQFTPSSATLLYLDNLFNSDNGTGYVSGGASSLSSSIMLLNSYYSLTQNQPKEQLLIDYIVANQNADGGFGGQGGSVHETAAAISALRSAHNQNHSQVIEDALSKLNTMQSVDGSFEGSVYSTAISIDYLFNDQRPNYSINAAFISGNQAVTGENLSINFDVLNQSDDEVANLVVAVVHDGQVLASETIGLIQANSVLADQISFPTSTLTGQSEIKLMIDPENLISESNENDNEANFQVNVLSVGNDVELVFDRSAVVLNPSYFDALPFDYVATLPVGNLSNTTVTGVDVTLSTLIDGELQEVIRLTEDINANEYVTFEFSGNITASTGAVEFIFTIDPDNSISEINEDNNQLNINLPQIATVDISINATDVTFSDPMTLGEPAEIEFNFANSGTLPSAGFQYKVNLLSANDPSVLYSGTVSEMTGGQQFSRSFNWTPLATGEFELEFLVDVADMVAEIDELNNQVILPVTVTTNTRTNLMLAEDSVVINPNPGLTGQTLEINTTVTNDSNTNSGIFSLNVYQKMTDNPNQLLETIESISSIPAGGSVVVPLVVDNYESYGEISFIAQVDPENLVDEFNENDNVATLMARVLNKPDASTSSGSFDLTPTVPVMGAPLSVTVSISNLGEQALVGLHAKLYLFSDTDSEFVDAINTSILDGGQSIELAFDFIYPDNQNFNQLMLVLDENNDIDEINELNNEAVFAIANQGNQFYVSNQYFSPNGDGIKDVTQLVFNAPESDHFSISIFNQFFETVKTFDFNDASAHGDVLWDGRDVNSKLVADGQYTVQISGSNTDFQKSTALWVDTNRSTLAEAIDEKNGYFTDLTCVLNDLRGWVQMSLDGQHIYTSWLVDKNNQNQKGLYKVKIDGSSIESMLPTSYFQSHQDTFRYIKYTPSGHVVFVPLNTGDDELWQLNPNDMVLRELNTNGVPDFSVSYILDSKILVQTGVDYYLIDRVGVAEPVMVAFPNQVSRFYSSENSGDVVLWSDSSNLYFQATFDDLINQTGSYLSLGEGELSVSNDGKLVLFETASQVAFYRSSRSSFQHVKDIDKPDSLGHHLAILRNNDVLWFSELGLVIYDQNGNQIHHLSHRYNYLSFIEQMREYYGSEHAIEYSGEAPIDTYSIDDVVNLQLDFNTLNINKGGDRELFLEFSAVLRGGLDLSEFGWGDLEEVEINPFNYDDTVKIKINYQDLAAVEEHELTSMYPQFSAFEESLSPYFLNRNTFYKKGSVGEPTARVTEFFDDYNKMGIYGSYSPNRAGEFVNKALVESNNSLVNRTCTHVGDHFIGVYQSNDNALALINANNTANGVEINGVATDRHFDRYTIEYKRLDQSASNWHLIKSSDLANYDGLFMYWFPAEAGRYQLKLTVYDRAGNHVSDTTETYVGNSQQLFTEITISPYLFSPNGDGINDSLHVLYEVLQPTELIIKINNSEGLNVRSYVREYVLPQTDAIDWDGRNGNGELLGDGIYYIKVGPYTFETYLDNTKPTINFLSRGRVKTNIRLLEEIPYLDSMVSDFDISDVPSDIFIPENRVSRTFEAFDPLLSSWASIDYDPYIYGYDPYSDNVITESQVRIKVTDTAGNQTISSTFEELREASFASELIHKSESGALNRVPLMGGCEPSKPYCSYTSDSISWAAHESDFELAQNERLVLALQTFVDQEVSTFRMTTYIDGEIHSIKDKNPLEVTDGLQFFTDQSQVPQSGLLPNLIRVRKQGLNFYIYLVELEQDDIVIDFDSRVDYEFQPLDTNGQIIDLLNQKANFQVKKEVLLNPGVLIDVSRFMVGDEVPPELLDYNLGKNLTHLDSQTVAVWENVKAQIERKPGHVYYLHQKVSDSEGDLTTFNNHLRVEFEDGFYDLTDVLPIYQIYGIEDGANYRAVLFEFEVLAPCAVPSEQVVYQATDSTQDNVSVVNADRGLVSQNCFLPSFEQLYEAHERCQSSAESNAHSILRTQVLLGSESLDLVSVEFFRYVNQEEDLLWTETNPVTVSGSQGLTRLFQADVQIDHSLFESGEHTIHMRFNTVEGRRFVTSYPIWVNNESIVPYIIEPTDSSGLFCAQDTESGPINIPHFMYMGSNLPYRASLTKTANGLPVELSNDYPVTTGELNSIDSLGIVVGPFLRDQELGFNHPKYHGPVTLEIETMNLTGVSSCDVVTIQVDSLIEGSVDRYESQFYISPNNDGVMDSYPYASISAEEPLTFTVELWKYVDGTTEFVGLIDTHELTQGEESELIWDGKFAGQTVADGRYAIKVVMIDGCGIKKAVSVEAVVDTTAPEISFNNPVNDQVAGPIEPVDFIVNEVNFDITLVNISFQFNGIWQELEIEEEVELGEGIHQVFSTWNLSQLPIGTYPLRVDIEDQAGNHNEYTIQVLRQEQQDLLWNYSISDRYMSPNDDGNKDQLTLELGLNHSAYVTIDIQDQNQVNVFQLMADTQMSAGGHDIPWDGLNAASQAVADGGYNLVTTVTEVGNPANSVTMTLDFVIDTLAPVINFTPHQPYLKGEGVLGLNVVEENFLPLSSTFQVMNPPGPVIDLVSIDNINVSNLVDLTTLDETTHQLHVYGADKAANSVSTTFELTIDNEPPVVELNHPIEGSFQTSISAELEVNGKAMDANFLSYEVSLAPDQEPLVWESILTGEQLEDDMYAETIELPQPDGSYFVKVLATDKAGWEAEKVNAFTVDTTAPTAQIDAPVTSSLHGNKVQIRGTASDENISHFTVSIRSVENANEPWFLIYSGYESVTSGDLFLWDHNEESGDYQLKLVVTDLAGQMNEHSVSIALDTSKPESPLYLQASKNQNDVALAWEHSQSTDVLGYEVWRNNQRLNEILVTNNSYDDLSLPEGEYTYWVVAVDGVGNRSLPSNNETVEIDTTAPDVYIHSPVAGQQVSGQIEIVGTAENTDDFQQLILSIREVANSPPGAVLATSNIALQSAEMAVLDTLPLNQDGEYVLRLEASDLNGNTNAVENHVFVDNLPPVAPLNLSYNITNNNDVNLDWDASQESDLLGYIVYRNNEIITGNGSIAASVIDNNQFTDTGVPDGTHSYYVVAVDQAHNVSLNSNTVELTIDLNAPHVSFVSPENDHEFEQPVAISTASDDTDIEQVLFEFSIDNTQWLVESTVTQPPYEIVFDPEEHGLQWGEVYIRATASDGSLTDLSPDVLSLMYADLTPPDNITGLVHQVTGADVNLSWDANSEDDLSGYVISRKLYDENQTTEFVVIHGGLHPNNTYTDSGLEDGQYLYRVQAVDENDNASEYVGSNLVRVFSIILDQPYSPVLTADDSLTITGSSIVSGEVHIDLSDLNGSHELDVVATEADGNFTINPPTLQFGMNEFTVRVVDVDGNQSKASSKTLYNSPEPLLPLNPAVSVNGFDVTFSWSQPAMGVAGYLPYTDGVPAFDQERILSGINFIATSNGYQGNNVVDNDYQTIWRPSSSDVNNGEPTYLELHFDQPKWVTKTTLYWDNDYYSDGRAMNPSAYEVQYLSTAGWITQKVYLDSEEPEVSVVSEIPYLASAVRIWMPLELYSYETIRLDEVDIQHQPFQTATEITRSHVDGTYEYQVSSINEYGFESQLTPEQIATVGDVEPPPAVTLSGETISINQVNLTWTVDDINELGGYKIYRDGEFIFDVNDSATLNYLDSGLANGVYQYYVVAYDLAGNHSTPSNEYQAEIISQLISAPTGLNVTAPNDGQSLILSWDAHSSINWDGFNLYRSQQQEQGYILINQTQLITAVDLEVTEGVRFYYYVTAVDLVGNESLPSAVVSEIPVDLTFPDPPVISEPTTAGNPIITNQSVTTISGSTSADVLVELYNNSQLYDSQQSTDSFSVMSLAQNVYYNEVVFNRHATRFAHMNYNVGKLVITDPVQASNIQLDAEGVNDYAWNSSGQKLVVSSGYGQFGKLSTYSAEGQHLEDLFSGYEVLVGRLNPSETLLFYWGTGVNPDDSEQEALWIYDLMTHQFSQVVLSVDEQLHTNGVLWINDSQIAFINYENGTYNPGKLWLYDVDTQQLSELVNETAERSLLTSTSDNGYLFLEVEDNGYKAVHRYGFNTQESILIAEENVDISMPMVLDSQEQVFVNYGCCSKALFHVESGQIMDQIEDTGYRSSGVWLNNGKVMTINNEFVDFLIPPGYFEFVSVPLNAGTNEFHALARKANGLVSEPSESIEVNLALSALTDLEIKPSYLQIIPINPLSGDFVSGSLLVKNNSAVDAEDVRLKIELIYPNLITQDLGASPIDFNLNAGGTLLETFTTPELSQTGQYQIRAVVDSNLTITEINENNNVVTKSFQVFEDRLPELSVILADQELNPGQNLEAEILVFNQTGTFDGELELTLTDDTGFPAGINEQFEIVGLGSESEWQAAVDWPLNDLYAGSYLLRAKLLNDANETIVASEHPLQIVQAVDFELALSVSSDAVELGNDLNISSQIKYLNGNVVQSGNLIWEITDQNQNLIWSDVTALSELLPGSTFTMEKQWPATETGLLEVKVALMTENHQSEVSLPVTINDNNQLTEVVGSLNPITNGVVLGQDFDITFEVSNPNQTNLVGLPVTLTVWDNQLNHVLVQFSDLLDLNQNQSLEITTPLSSNGMLFASYVVVLQADLSAYGGQANQVLDSAVINPIDGSGPLIHIVTPVESAHYSGAVRVAADVEDQWSDVNTVSALIENLVQLQLPLDPIIGQYQRWMEDLPEGNHTIKVTATDEYQNFSEAQTSFTIDNTVPEISISGVVDSGLYATAQQSIIDVTDLHLNTSQITLNGQAYTSGTIIINEGSYQLQVYASDFAGNTAAAQIDFVIDLTAPVVTISHPQHQSETNQSTTFVSGQTEAFATVYLSVGSHTDTQTSDFQGAFSFSDVPLEPGINNMAVYAIDQAGNTGAATQVSVSYIDSVDVEGLISASATHGLGQTLDVPWSVTNLHQFAVSALPVRVEIYRLNDNSLVLSDNQMIDLGGLETVNSSSMFATQGLTPGSHKVELEVDINGAWQILDEHLIEFSDVTGPNIQVVIPTTNQLTNQTLGLLVAVTDDFSEVTSVTYRVDTETWQDMVANGNQYTADINLTHGAHLISFKAVDEYDNESEVLDLAVNADTEAPEITVIHPNDGLITNQPVTLDFVVTDDHQLTVDSQLNSATVSSGYLVEDEGEYELTIEAEDEVNNSSNATRTFVIDTTPPSLVVTSPISGEANTSGLVDVLGQAEPRNDIHITINGFETILKTDATGAFELYQQPLEVGDNTIVVVAKDRAGNESEPVDLTVEYIQVGTISGRIWDDFNADGILDLEEPGLSQVEVSLTDDQNLVTTQLTNQAGDFEFTMLMPGNYDLAVTDADLLNNWQNTSANQNQSIEITGNQTFQTNIGYYQDKPEIFASLSANNLRGRLLILVDPETAAVDDLSCEGVQLASLQHQLPVEFATGMTIWATLTDQNNTIIQTESASYADFINNGFSPVDDISATQSINLVLHPVDFGFIKASAVVPDNNPAATIPAGITLSVGLDHLADHYQWSSGVISNNCALFDSIGEDLQELTLTDVDTYPATGTDDPGSNEMVETLSVQHQLLKNVLDYHEWSYQLVADEAAFADALSSGEFVSYVLLAESIDLTTTTQNQLITAMNDGAGVFVLSGQDNLDAGFYDAFGIQVSGSHLGIEQMNLLTSPIHHSDTSPVMWNESGLKISVQTAETAAVFTGPGISSPENVALSWMEINSSVRVMSGLDWLLQATAETGLSHYAHLINQVISFVHPLGLSHELGQVRSVKLEVLNVGRAVSGQVQVDLPVGVTLASAPVLVTPTIDGFSFDYALLEEQALELEFWFKVDTTPVDISFEFFAGNQTVPFESLLVTLIAGEKPDLQTSLTNCVSGINPSGEVSYDFTIRNTGNKDISGAHAYTQFVDSFQSVNWTCAATGGGVCHNTQGQGNLNKAAVTLPVGAEVIYQMTSQVNADLGEVLNPQARIEMPESSGDINPADNFAADADQVYRFIFNDGFECAAPGVLDAVHVKSNGLQGK